MPYPRALVALFGALGASGCIVTSTVGAAVDVAGAAASTTIKAGGAVVETTGAVARAAIPGDGEDDDAARETNEGDRGRANGSIPDAGER